MKVYVLTTGSYSDYGIHSIYTDKCLAEEVYNAINVKYSDAELEEWDTDGFPEYLNKVRNGYRLYLVVMDKNGDTDRVEIVNPEWNENSFISVARGQWPTRLYVHCWATSGEHAVKITNEKRIMLIANGDWNE